MHDYEVQPSHDQLDGYPSPSQVTEIFGHDKQAEFLADIYASGRMHHALLFDGAPGIGKASMAFLFARHIIANPDFNAAPKLLGASSDEAIIRQIAMGAHPQVLHLTRPLDHKTGKHKTQITIEETRRISHFLGHTIPGNGYRIIIIDPVHDMNANAANALLKNLEEPTPRTLFILIAQSSGRLLPTIRSRCLTVRFQTLDDAAMRQALAHLGLKVKLDGQGVDELIARADGSVRVAATLFDNGGLEIIKTAETILDQAEFNGTLALKLGEAVSSREAEPIFVLLCDYLINRVARDANLATQNGNRRGNALAKFHLELTDSIAQSTLYNLDKRQIVLSILRKCHSAQIGL